MSAPAVNESLLKRFLFVRFTTAMGDYFLMFALPILVYRLTGSIQMSGRAFFLEWLPRVVLLPFGGGLIDRFGPLRALPGD